MNPTGYSQSCGVQLLMKQERVFQEEKVSFGIEAKDSD